MSRTPASFKVCDLERAVKGARNVGLPILRTEIGKDGRIVLIHSETPAAPNNIFDMTNSQFAASLARLDEI